MIRIANHGDLLQINEIYNIAIDSRIATADLDHISYDSRLIWFEDHNPKLYPIFVFEKEGSVRGWISVSPYRKNRRALDGVVEVSYYVHPQYHGQGIGSLLIKHIIDNAHNFGIHFIICILLEINEASIRLLNKFEFQRWGYLPDIVNIEGKICSHLIYGLKISDHIF